MQPAVITDLQNALSNCNQATTDNNPGPNASAEMQANSATLQTKINTATSAVQDALNFAQQSYTPPA